MSDREKELEDALRRVIDVADVTRPSVSTTEIHDAIGFEIIVDLCFPVRWMTPLPMDMP